MSRCRRVVVAELELISACLHLVVPPLIKWSYGIVTHKHNGTGGSPLPCCDDDGRRVRSRLGSRRGGAGGLSPLDRAGARWTDDGPRTDLSLYSTACPLVSFLSRAFRWPKTHAQHPLVFTFSHDMPQRAAVKRRFANAVISIISITIIMCVKTGANE